MRKGLLILFAVAAIACTKESPALDEALVVEGWIDDGGYPTVIVSTTIARPDDPVEPSDLLSFIARGAQVSISDGEKTVGLIGRPSGSNFPPYIYSTLRMKGEAGKTYTLRVSYKDFTATAVTTIPPKEILDNVEIIGTEDNYRVNCTFQAEPGKYYGFFEKDEQNLGISPVFLGLVNGDVTPGEQTVTVFRATGLNSVWDYSFGFSSGENVEVRFCSMEEGIWRYWNAFQETVGISSLVLYPMEGKHPTNMQGAYGYWAGYGTTALSLTMPQGETISED